MCLSLNSFAGETGGNGTGGGAGICRRSGCLTLAQAAVTSTNAVIRPAGRTQDQLAISPAVAQEVQNIIDKLPLTADAKDLLLRKAFRPHQFYVIADNASAHQEEINRISNEYASALGGHLPDGFTVFAFSSLSSNPRTCDGMRGTTTLLPAFFNLDVRGQALVLIHEGMYVCERNGKLPLVLEVDREILRIVREAEVNAARGATTAFIDAINLISPLYELRYYEIGNTLTSWISEIVYSARRRLSARGMASDPRSFFNHLCADGAAFLEGRGDCHLPSGIDLYNSPIRPELDSLLNSFNVSTILWGDLGHGLRSSEALRQQCTRPGMVVSFVDDSVSYVLIECAGRRRVRDVRMLEGRR